MTIRCTAPDPALIRTPADVRRGTWTGFVVGLCIGMVVSSGLAIAIFGA